MTERAASATALVGGEAAEQQAVYRARDHLGSALVDVAQLEGEIVHLVGRQVGLVDDDVVVRRPRGACGGGEYKC